MSDFVPTDVRVLNSLTSALVSVVVLVGVVTLIWWGMHHPVFAIRGISVQGDVAHNSASSLRATVLPQLTGNFFTMNLSSARQAFEAAPWVRKAVVEREFPSQLKVTLEEHEPLAHWGGALTHMVNTHGEVFDAFGESGDYSNLPVLKGPDGQAQELLNIFNKLAPIAKTMGLQMTGLELLPRGGWRAELNNGAEVVLGKGSISELAARMDLLSKTAPEIARRQKRKISDLASADMRYPGAYAIKLNGVSTVLDDVSQPAKAVTRLVTKRN